MRHNASLGPAGMAALAVARERLVASCNSAWASFLSDFAAQYVPFRAAVRALASLDALLSLSTVASNPG
jgi:DNA mismatch repair protein MSH3